MLGPVQQREQGIFLTGMGLAFTVAAMITWTRRFSKNKKAIVQLFPLLLSFAVQILMCSNAVDLLETNISKKTMVTAFLSSNCNDLVQYCFTYFTAMRLLSLISPTQVRKILFVKLYCAAIVALYFIDHVASFVALGKSNLNLITFLYSWEFNKLGKLSTLIGLLMYLVMVFGVDLWLIIKIRNCQKAIHSNIKIRSGHTQSLIILLSLAVKVAESVYKLHSVIESYSGMDSYMRSLNAAVEIWSITELGITVEEILNSGKSNSLSKGNETHEQFSIQKQNSVKRLPGSTAVLPSMVLKEAV
ncbi:hypothetical protein SpCBS45565_g03200 [Spizellomyces sp. 'palustris']|nr:hypothetical protein SpCBS45565_g03200 [Spizellomyces sp. 'palustris']